MFLYLKEQNEAYEVLFLEEKIAYIFMKWKA